MDILQEEKKQNGRLKNGSMKGQQRMINQNSLVSMRFLTHETWCWSCGTVCNKRRFSWPLCRHGAGISIATCLRDFSNTETLCHGQEYWHETDCSRGPAKAEHQKAAHDSGLAPRAVQVRAPHTPNDLTRWSSCWNCSSLMPTVTWCIWTACTSWLWWQSTGAVLLIMALCQYYCGEKSCCWLLFADDVVEKMDAQAIEELYGLTSDIKNKS